jgi:hypothetical protein
MAKDLFPSLTRILRLQDDRWRSSTCDSRDSSFSKPLGPQLFQVLPPSTERSTVAFAPLAHSV